MAMVYGITIWRHGTARLIEDKREYPTAEQRDRCIAELRGFINGSRRRKHKMGEATAVQPYDREG